MSCPCKIVSCPCRIVSCPCKIVSGPCRLVSCVFLSINTVILHPTQPHDAILHTPYANFFPRVVEYPFGPRRNFAQDPLVGHLFIRFTRFFVSLPNSVGVQNWSPIPSFPSVVLYSVFHPACGSCERRRGARNPEPNAWGEMSVRGNRTWTSLPRPAV